MQQKLQFVTARVFICCWYTSSMYVPVGLMYCKQKD